MDEEFQFPVRRRKKKIPAWKRFLRRHSTHLILLVLTCSCLGMVIFTATSISAMIQGKMNQQQMQNPPSDNGPSEEELAQLNALISKADFMAAGYDYQGAIALMQTYPNYETQSVIVEKINAYSKADESLLSYPDLDSITHIFFHSLIVDADRAFDGDIEEAGYNRYMVTVEEFEKILQSMYDRGFVLVSPYDIAYEVTNENGSHFEYGNIRLPAGKTPFLMSQDDVNYYGYMIGTGNGKDETPVFADTNGDGFAHKIVIGQDGFPTCEYMDANGNIHTGDYDLVPILERFIQEHPDFSYHGARAILGVTGYEGVFGYRTKPSYETALGTETYQKEVADAKAVAQCLKEHGWILASHSYGHPAYGNIDATRVETDSDKWETTCQPIIGETDILLFPNGSDINSFHKYTTENEKFNALYEDGYRYFFNVDSKISWCQVGDTYFRASRRNVDGYRMFHNPDKLSDLFDVSAVFDSRRPTPVPTVGGSM